MGGWGNQKEEEGGDEKKQECEQNPVCWCAQKQIDLCELCEFEASLVYIDSRPGQQKAT